MKNHGWFFKTTPGFLIENPPVVFEKPIGGFKKNTGVFLAFLKKTTPGFFKNVHFCCKNQYMDLSHITHDHKRTSVFLAIIVKVQCLFTSKWDFESEDSLISNFKFFPPKATAFCMILLPNDWAYVSYFAWKYKYIIRSTA